MPQRIVPLSEDDSAPDLDGTASSHRVLVVEDSQAQRKVIALLLRRWGFEVLEASSGEEALEIVGETQIDIVISDWVMPGMSGPVLCETLRALNEERYTYFILLSSKSEKAEIAQGLGHGADEFVTKPVNPQELRARIRAGERILEMQSELHDKNALLTTTLDELRALYDLLDRDLVEARHLQQSLVPERFLNYNGADVSLLLRPSGHVGGDLVGSFRVNESRFCAYSIDVSGHGIASALMTARLAAHLSGSMPENNVALMIDDLGFYSMRPTDEICHELNRILLEEMETEQYFTMVIADVDLRAGTARMTQAGHPESLVIRKDNSIEFVGTGSMPIGLLPEPVFESFEIQIAKGDRIFMYSDGFVECPDQDDVQLGDDGLVQMVERQRGASGEAFLEAVVWELSEYRGDQNFPDDVSAALIEVT